MKRIAWFAGVAGALLLVLVGLAACGGGGDSAKLRAQVATLQTQVAKPTLTTVPTATTAATATATPELTATPIPPTPTATSVPPTQTPVVVYVAQPTPTVSGRTLPCTNIVLGFTETDSGGGPIGTYTIQNRTTGFVADIKTTDVFQWRPVGSCYPEGGTPEKDPPH